jgi:putative hemolysin
MELEWLDLARPLEELREIAAKSNHHRFPVGVERIDRVRGFVTLTDLWREDVCSSADVEKHIREALFFPETGDILTLLQRFRETRIHLAIIIDEFGGVEGIATPSDILEALVGELPARDDDFEPSLVRRSDGSWSFDGSVDLDEIEAVTAFSMPGRKEEFQTIGGYLVSHLGKMPRVGDSIVIGDYRFDIARADSRRIQRVIVTRYAMGPGA